MTILHLLPCLTVYGLMGAGSSYSANLKLFWGVQHEVPSPAYPQCNEKAEATVKSIKKLIWGSSTQRRLDEDKLARAVLRYRNIPCVKDKLSPAQKLYVHPVQDTLSVGYTVFAHEWQTKMKGRD